MITAPIADDDGVVRNSLPYLLEAQGDIQVIRLADGGRGPVEQAMHNCPNVAATEISIDHVRKHEAL